MIEEIINLKLAMKQNKPKKVVTEKYQAYMKIYDNKDKDILDKVEHRDLFYDYIRYMSKSGDVNNG